MSSELILTLMPFFYLGLVIFCLCLPKSLMRFLWVFCYFVFPFLAVFAFYSEVNFINSAKRDFVTLGPEGTRIANDMSPISKYLYSNPTAITIYEVTFAICLLLAIAAIFINYRKRSAASRDTDLVSDLP